MEITTPRDPRYVGILALAACTILVAGWLVRPRETPQARAPVPSETELEQLARRAERRSLESMASYFAGVARDVQSSLVHIRTSRTSGIVWDEGHILIVPLQRGPAPDAVIVSADSGETGAKLNTWGPHLPLVALERPQRLTGLFPARRAVSPPNAGDWIVAVWRTGQGHSFTAGSFLQPVSTTCGVTQVQEVATSLSFTSTMLGGGVFDIDGGLLGVILQCRDRIAAVATASIQAILERGETIEQRVSGLYGLGLGSLSAEEKAYFNTTGGALVREVWTGYADDVAGIRPGDIVTTVNGQAVTTPDDLRVLTTSSDTPFEVTVRRGTKTLKFALSTGVPPAESGSLAAGAGLVWETSPRSYRIDSVLPGSRSALAGIEPGDRLTRIDFVEPRNLSQVQQIFAGSKPASRLLEIDRDGRRLAVLIQ